MKSLGKSQDKTTYMPYDHLLLSEHQYCEHFLFPLLHLDPQEHQLRFVNYRLEVIQGEF